MTLSTTKALVFPASSTSSLGGAKLMSMRDANTRACCRTAELARGEGAALPVDNAIRERPLWAMERDRRALERRLFSRPLPLLGAAKRRGYPARDSSAGACHVSIVFEFPSGQRP